MKDNSDALESYICAVLVLVLLVMVLAEVLSRALVGESIFWIEEISRVVFVWAVFFGTSAGIKHGAHISVDTLFKRLPDSTKNVITVVSFIVQFIAIVFLFYSGILLLNKYGNQGFIVTGLRKSALYFSWPVTGLFMLYRLLRRMRIDISADTVESKDSQ